MMNPSFDAFWQETIALARAEPLEETVEPVKDPQPYFTFHVTYRSFGGARVTSKLGVPVVEPGTRLPAIITAPGYGGWEHGSTLSECQRGYLVLQVFPRGQGLSQDQPSGDTSVGYLLRGIADPKEYFYRGAFMDMLRGVDYLLTRPDVDPARIGMMGTSQGGGIVLSSSALEPRVRAVVAHVPFFCHMAHNAAFKDSEMNTPESLATFAYFDPVSHASNLRAATLLSSGGKDTTCLPETIRAVYDRLPGIKGLLHYPGLVHTSSLAFYQMSWEWMGMYL
ncbi:MAG: acetylxylan esterase [Armatimonadota bacterium]